MRLKDKVALITGGSGGIGSATCRLFAREGAKVAICDRNEVKGRQLEAELSVNGGQCLFIKMDVTGDEDWKRAVSTVVEAYGRLDVLVNGAGVFSRRKLPEADSQLWHSEVDVNAKGTFLGTKYAIPEMVKAGGGAIVNIGSVSGVISLGFPVYNSSKGAVRILSKNLAVEYAPQNIRVNCVNPGPIDTPMMADDPNTAEYWYEKIPIGRIGRPEEVAYGILFLASDEASYITGADLMIDGGYVAQ